MLTYLSTTLVLRYSVLLLSVYATWATQNETNPLNGKHLHVLGLEVCDKRNYYRYYFIAIRIL